MEPSVAAMNLSPGVWKPPGVGGWGGAGGPCTHPAPNPALGTWEQRIGGQTEAVGISGLGGLQGLERSHLILPLCPAQNPTPPSHSHTNSTLYLHVCFHMIFTDGPTTVGGGPVHRALHHLTISPYHGLVPAPTPAVRVPPESGLATASTCVPHIALGPWPVGWVAFLFRRLGGY